MLSKRYESIEVDRRTWLHVPSSTPWMCWQRWARSAMSFAKSRSSRDFSNVQNNPPLFWLAVFFITQSIHITKSRGDSKHPCLTPALVGSCPLGLCHTSLWPGSHGRASWWWIWSCLVLVFRSEPWSSTLQVDGYCQMPWGSRWNWHILWRSIRYSVP